ncbi:hypothetical protein SDC9_171777 [bioreactor metagenome]|uniref:Protein translocase subunit SecA n=1 Tax=bioreactor metagenome TaxID=1076179 RepID=A0A645GF19_9ZZZZ|nr:SEC-C metal-binding domain-containing protein [Candidatus Metalachnospira sp.]
MGLYESWMKKAFTQKGQSVDEVWNDYLPLEQKIYEYILEEKIQDMEYKISEIAEKFNMTDEQAVAFVDGINDVLPEPYDVNQLEADTIVKLHIEFDELYKKMVEYKAEHLYSLPQWNNIFTADEQNHLFKAQRNARTVVNEGPKVGRNDPCPCGSGKKFKKCCGANL